MSIRNLQPQSQALGPRHREKVDESRREGGRMGNPEGYVWTCMSLWARPELGTSETDAEQDGKAFRKLKQDRDCHPQRGSPVHLGPMGGLLLKRRNLFGCEISPI